MKLSVIIVNYNQKYFPRMCIEALLNSRSPIGSASLPVGDDTMGRRFVEDDSAECHHQKESFPGNIKGDTAQREKYFEIIVVDNASEDESLPYLQKMEQECVIHLIQSKKNLGYGQANNLGVQRAKGEYVLILNPDVFVEPETLSIMVDYMEKHPYVGILGPKIVYHNGELQPSCRRFMTFTDLIIKRTPLRYFGPFKKRLRKYIMLDFDHEKTQEVDLLVGACFMLRKSVFEKLGGFDKRYFLFMEDFDLCQKAHKEGLKIVYFSKTRVIHFHKRLSDGSLLWLFFKKPFWHHLISSAKYFWQWRGAAKHRK